MWVPGRPGLRNLSANSAQVEFEAHEQTETKPTGHAVSVHVGVVPAQWQFEYALLTEQNTGLLLEGHTVGHVEGVDRSRASASQPPLSWAYISVRPRSKICLLFTYDASLLDVGHQRITFGRVARFSAARCCVAVQWILCTRVATKGLSACYARWPGRKTCRIECKRDLADATLAIASAASSSGPTTVLRQSCLQDVIRPYPLQADSILTRGQHRRARLFAGHEVPPGPVGVVKKVNVFHPSGQLSPQPVVLH
jgi:hypothetical protein